MVALFMAYVVNYEFGKLCSNDCFRLNTNNFLSYIKRDQANAQLLSQIYIACH